jgi:hypothetical protein
MFYTLVLRRIFGLMANQKKAGKKQFGSSAINEEEIKMVT